MNQFQINLFATRDLDGCLCAVLAHLLAAEKYGGVSVEWINPGDASPVSRLTQALSIAWAYEAPLPEERIVYVAGAKCDEKTRSEFAEMSDKTHRIWVLDSMPPRMSCVHMYTCVISPTTSVVTNLVYGFVNEWERRAAMEGLLAITGPDNFVNVITAYCRTHPQSELRLTEFHSLQEFLNMPASL